MSFMPNVARSSILMTWVLLVMLIFPTSYVMWSSNSLIIDWMISSMNPTPLTLSIIIDQTGMIFCCTVLFISANVLSFSTIYMADDKFIDRFTYLVLLFIASMMILIFFPNFMALLLGWDGLGFTSFVLVIYYQNAKSLAAGMLTALSNRVGDALLLVAISCTLDQGHWNIIHMWNYSNYYIAQILFIMVAAMTKSAQMPFSSWLPAAMAAPTPVSALVHSSTLVTAGIFLMLRFYNFLHSIYMFNLLILMVATCTMFMAGLSALTECDMKKIIALSTLSQLGLMMMSIGLNMPNLAFFHMVTHAMFKALLFICAGSFINYHLHSQDLRWMGNLANQMPIASSCITISNMSLCGFPFMSGFYSKDMIMELCMYNSTNFIICMLAMISVGITAFYSMRFMLMTLWAPHLSCPHIMMKEANMITTPMINLSVMATVMGAILSWSFQISSSITHMNVIMKLMPLLMVFMGILLSYMFISTYTTNLCSLSTSPINHWASCSMWFLTPLSTQFMINQPMKIAHSTMKLMDQGWIELPQMLHSNIITYANIQSHMNMMPSIITMNNSLLALALIISIPMIM